MKKLLKFLAVITVVCSMTACGSTGKNAPLIVNQSYSYEQGEKNDLTIESFKMYGSAYLEKLKTAYKLDELVSACKTDFDKVVAITKWVSNLWEHDGWNAPEKSDPLFILDEVTKNGKQFRCVEYGIVINGCLNAIGIPARGIGLKTRDVETRESGAGHVAAEVYLADLHKWIFVDGQFGVIPTLDGTPLNAVEFGAALQKGETDKRKLDLIKVLEGVDNVDYYSFVNQYLYYLDVSYFEKDDPNHTSPQSMMLVPIDAAHPTKFQVEYPLQIDVFTNAVSDLYPTR